MKNVDELSLDDAAAVHDALGHPIRVAIQRALRGKNEMTMPELRRAVSEAYIPLDTRNLQFHLFKMQVSGIVIVTKKAGRDVATLQQDVVTRFKKSP
jgi:DNA-binding transcriptional ArsR family regulator